MNPLHTNIDTDLTLLHLTPAEAADPLQVLRDFCDDYTPGACRNVLDELVKIALINDFYNNPNRRERLLLWSDRFLRFIEASFAQQQVLQHPASVPS